MKTVIVGFDALDFRYLDAFSDELPNFTELRGEGVEAPLESSFPPWTGSAWPSMYTGVDPSRHGVYSFFNHGGTYPDEATLITRNDVRAPALWNYLSDRGEESVVLNVPVTHPAESFEGVLFPGYLASENEASFPPEARGDLDRALGEPYRIYAEHETSKDLEKKVDSYVSLVKQRGRAAANVLGEYDWSVAFVQFQKTDTVFHSSPNEMDHRRVYRAADDALGAIRSTVGDDVNVIVCSDHGMRPLDGHQIYLNEILAREGFVEMTASTSGASLPDAKSRLVDGEEPDAKDNSTKESGLPERAASALVAGLNAVNLSPGKLYVTSQRLGVDSLVDRFVPQSVVDSADRGVDWRRSVAYCCSGSELGVRINLQDREPDGVVSKSEYESVRDDLIELLQGLETPDGDPVFEWVARREEVYDGPYTNGAADVLFMPKDMNNVIMTRTIGTTFSDTAAYGHDVTGAFIASGPAFEGVALDSLSLLDVAPIALAAAGHPVPTSMTGSVPDGLLSYPVKREKYGSVSYGSDSDVSPSDDTDAVEDRLADLGYI